MANRWNRNSKVRTAFGLTTTTTITTATNPLLDATCPIGREIGNEGRGGREWKIARFRASRFVSGLRIAWRFAFQTFNRIRLTGNKWNLHFVVRHLPGYQLRNSLEWIYRNRGDTSFVLFHHVVKLIRLFTLVTFPWWNLWLCTSFRFLRAFHCSERRRSNKPLFVRIIIYFYRNF